MQVAQGHRVRRRGRLGSQALSLRTVHSKLPPHLVTSLSQHPSRPHYPCLRPSASSKRVDRVGTIFAHLEGAQGTTWRAQGVLAGCSV